MAHRRRGSIVAAVMSLLLVLGIVAGSLYSRHHVMKLEQQRLEHEVRVRFLVDSTLVLLVEQGRTGSIKEQEVYELDGGRAGHIIGELRTEGEARYRPAVVFGRSGGSHKELYVQVVPDAPELVGGAPIKGRTSLERITDVTDCLPVDLCEPQGPAAIRLLVAQARSVAGCPEP